MPDELTSQSLRIEECTTAIDPRRINGTIEKVLTLLDAEGLDPVEAIIALIGAMLSCYPGTDALTQEDAARYVHDWTRQIGEDILKRHRH